MNSPRATGDLLTSALAVLAGAAMLAWLLAATGQRPWNASSATFATVILVPFALLTGWTARQSVRGASRLTFSPPILLVADLTALTAALLPWLGPGVGLLALFGVAPLALWLLVVAWVQPVRSTVLAATVFSSVLIALLWLLLIGIGERAPSGVVISAVSIAFVILILWHVRLRRSCADSASAGVGTIATHRAPGASSRPSAPSAPTSSLPSEPGRFATPTLAAPVVPPEPSRPAAEG